MRRLKSEVKDQRIQGVRMSHTVTWSYLCLFFDVSQFVDSFFQCSRRTRSVSWPQTLLI